MAQPTPEMLIDRIMSSLNKLKKPCSIGLVLYYPGTDTFKVHALANNFCADSAIFTSEFNEAIEKCKPLSCTVLGFIIRLVCCPTQNMHYMGPNGMIACPEACYT